MKDDRGTPLHAARILFVDDEPWAMARYVEELERLGPGFRTFFVGDIDTAVAVLDVEPFPFRLVVWDMAMPAGKTFADEPTESGLRTGSAFHALLREKHPTVPRLLFTNFAALLEGYDQPEVGDYAFAKRDLLPYEFAAEVSKVAGPPADVLPFPGGER